MDSLTRRRRDRMPMTFCMPGMLDLMWSLVKTDCVRYAALLPGSALGALGTGSRTGVPIFRGPWARPERTGIVVSIDVRVVGSATKAPRA